MDLHRSQLFYNLKILSCCPNANAIDHLVADPFSKKIYLISTWKGRILVWIYTIVSLLRRKNLLEERRYKIILHTIEAFDKAIQELETIHQHYFNEVKQSYKKNTLENKQEFLSRFHLIKAHETIWPIINPFEIYNNFPNYRKIQHIFSSILGQQEIDVNQEMIISKMSQLIEEWALAAVEGFLEQDTPLEEIACLVANTPLRTDQDKKIRDWIHGIQNNCYVTADMLHHALKTTVRLVDEGGSNVIDQVAFVESRLIQMGCKKLWCFDPFCKYWEENLTSCSRLDFGTSEIILGEEWIVPNLEQLGLRAFVLAPEQMDLVLIPDNLAVLNIYNLFWKRHSWGVPPPEVKNIDWLGRYMVLHKYCNVISQYPWSSSSLELNPEDSPMMYLLIRLIAWMKEQAYSLSHFTPSEIFYDREFRLGMIQSFEREDFDYHKIEEFVFQASQGKLVIYSILMRQSGLVFHPIAQAYRKVIEASFQESPIEDIVLFLAELEIIDPKIVRHAKQLIEEAQALRNRIMDWIRLTSNNIDSSQDIQYQANQLVINFQRKWCLGGRTWSITEDIMSDLRLRNIF